MLFYFLYFLLLLVFHQIIVAGKGDPRIDSGNVCIPCACPYKRIVHATSLCRSPQLSNLRFLAIPWKCANSSFLILSERLEITSLKAAGVSLYRLFIPYLMFGLISAVGLSALDAWIIPASNAQRIQFEEQYIKQKNEQLDRNDIYRELSPGSYLQVNYFDRDQQTAYRIRMVQFDQRGVKKLLTATNMAWLEDKNEWRLTTVQERIFTDSGFVERNVAGFDTLLSLLPQDLARSSSDIYQLSYTEAFQYIDGIKRSGASGIEIPQVQLYARMAYPFSIVVVLIIGFAVAAVRRRGGKGVYIAAGLVISFLYLVIMKIMEPFGALGLLPPIWAALIPHLLFLCVGIIGIKLIRK